MYTLPVTWRMPGITLPGSFVALEKPIRTVLGTSDPPVASDVSVPEVGVTMLSHGVMEPVLLVTWNGIGTSAPWLNRYVVRSTVLGPGGRPGSGVSRVPASSAAG